VWYVYGMCQRLGMESLPEELSPDELSAREEEEVEEEDEEGPAGPLVWPPSPCL